MKGYAKWKGVPVAVVSAVLLLSPVPGEGGARIGASVGPGAGGPRAAVPYGAGGQARGFGGLTGVRGAVDVGSGRVRVEFGGKGGTKERGQAWRGRWKEPRKFRDHGGAHGRSFFYGWGGGLQPGFSNYRRDPFRFRPYRTYPYYRAYPYYRSYPYYPSYPVSPSFRVESYGQAYTGTVYGDEGQGSSMYRPDREAARTPEVGEEPPPRGRAHPRVARALDDNAVGESATWFDPATGSENTVTPTRDLGGDGRCREFTHTVSTPGGRVESWGVACLTPQGRWEVDL